MVFVPILVDFRNQPKSNKFYSGVLQKGVLAVWGPLAGILAGRTGVADRFDFIGIDDSVLGEGRFVCPQSSHFRKRWKRRFPPLVSVFKNEPECRHFGEYLTGLIIAQRKTVLGIPWWRGANTWRI